MYSFIMNPRLPYATKYSNILYEENSNLHSNWQLAFFWTVAFYRGEHSTFHLNSVDIIDYFCGTYCLLNESTSLGWYDGSDAKSLNYYNCCLHLHSAIIKNISLKLPLTVSNDIRYFIVAPNLATLIMSLEAASSSWSVEVLRHTEQYEKWHVVRLAPHQRFR